MTTASFARVVVGGGLFGSVAALVLAELGYRVLLIEQGPKLMTRASTVNQARLHTGLHYPRSYLTARESLRYYQSFRERFEPAVHDFEQIYAVSRNNSRTSGDEFSDFVDRLGIEADEVNPTRWFHPGTIDRAFRVEEPTFDANTLRGLLAEELSRNRSIEVYLNTAVVGGDATQSPAKLVLSDGRQIVGEGIVLAVYASTNAVREALGLPSLALTFELAEVVLGRAAPPLKGMGFTVMDGPFWSLMPFGATGRVSLTSVGLTPTAKSAGQPEFRCQSARTGCLPLSLADCNECNVRPPSTARHQQQQMSMFLKDASAFTQESSLMTVKAILTSAEVDDARPTLVKKEDSIDVWTVFSGKVSTLFDLAEVLT